MRRRAAAGPRRRFAHAAGAGTGQQQTGPAEAEQVEREEGVPRDKGLVLLSGVRGVVQTHSASHSAEHAAVLIARRGALPSAMSAMHGACTVH